MAGRSVKTINGCRSCTKCGILKPLAAFNKQRTVISGHRSICRTCQTTYRKDYYQKNSTKELAYRVANKNELRMYKRQWEHANPEKTRSYRRANYLKYRAKHIERAAASGAKRKARLWGAAINDFTLGEWNVLVDVFGKMCAYCGIEPQQLTKDHVIPLARGGNHTYSNIVPACAHCNLSKNKKTADEFLVYTNGIKIQPAETVNGGPRV